LLVRKRASNKMLEDKFTKFVMFLVLTFCQLLASITRVAFQLNNADRTNIETVETSKQQKRTRMRILFKGAPAEDRPPKQYTMRDILTTSKREIQRLWEGLLNPLAAGMFCVASGFWPLGENISNISNMFICIQIP
jgi:hypothetical protein